MKLATIRLDGVSAICLVRPDGRPVLLKEAIVAAGLRTELLPQSMIELIESFERRRSDLERADFALAKARAVTGTFDWLPPIPRPSKILGCAINNGGVSRLASVCPDKPNFFAKLSSCLIGHGQPIIIRPDYGLTHPEDALPCASQRVLEGIDHLGLTDCANFRDLAIKYVCEKRVGEFI